MSEINEIVKEFLAEHGKEMQSGQKTLTPHNSFRALFDCKETSEAEVKEIQVLFQGHLKGLEDEEAVRLDFKELVQLTSELRAIQRQAVLLVGERLFRVREIFRKYGGEETGGFTSWLSLAFTSKKTAYNALAFYDLYSGLPSEELRDNLKKMPVKAGYILASRRGEPEVKCTIIREYNGEKQKEIIDRIEEQLPIRRGDQRSPRDLVEKTLDEMEYLTTLLDRRLALVRKEDMARVEKIVLRLKSLVDLF